MNTKGERVAPVDTRFQRLSEKGDPVELISDVARLWNTKISRRNVVLARWTHEFFPRMIDDRREDCDFRRENEREKGGNSLNRVIIILNSNHCMIYSSFYDLIIVVTPSRIACDYVSFNTSVFSKQKKEGEGDENVFRAQLEL